MKVILSQLAHLKMKYYINSVDTEISGIGLVQKLANNDLYVSDLFIYKQVVTGAHTKLDQREVAKFIDEKLQIPDFPVENLKLWWHSHVDMGCFWSGTDDETIDGLDIESSEENWWLSIVTTRDGKRRARVDTYQPFRMTVDEIPVEVGEDLDLKETLVKEVEELVSENIQTSGQIVGPDGKPLIKGVPFSNDTQEENSFYHQPPYQGQYNGNKKKKHKHH